MKKGPSINYSSEDLWSAILSQDEKKVSGFVKILDPETVEYLNRHLNKMISEEGWHPAQRASASFALQIIKNLIRDEE